jgi:hypothetical protein
VSAATIARHAPAPSTDAAALRGWHLCPSGPACHVIYFRGDEVLLAADVRGPPYHKGSGADRTVCFCFGHTERAVADEVSRTGRSTIRDTVREACRQGRADCERLNPQGRCCLGDVGRIVDATAAGPAPRRGAG